MEAGVIVVGGGLAGMVAALELAGSGIDVLVIEKRGYPSHKVCGEYVSNEVKPYLESLGLDLSGLGAIDINKLSVTTQKGSVFKSELDCGGFGLSRFSLDNALYNLCLSKGIRFMLHTSVSGIEKSDGRMTVRTNGGDLLNAALVIGAYGKRSVLDTRMKRAFTEKSAPYMAVKYHVRYEQPKSLISLHNFENGYCGISAIENGLNCLCYLTNRSNLKKSGGNISRMEHEILGKNPHLRHIFENSEICYDKPLVINEISFSPKTSVENGMYMAGDAAGLIAPLCGNGMAMAIHSAKILGELTSRHLTGSFNSEELERQYQNHWQKTFGGRLLLGRIVQGTFGKSWLTETIVGILQRLPPLSRKIISLTHGRDLLKF